MLRTARRTPFWDCSTDPHEHKLNSTRARTRSQKVVLNWKNTENWDSRWWLTNWASNRKSCRGRLSVNQQTQISVITKLCNDNVCPCASHPSIRTGSSIGVLHRLPVFPIFGLPLWRLLHFGVCCRHLYPRVELVFSAFWVIVIVHASVSIIVQLTGLKEEEKTH